MMKAFRSKQSSTTRPSFKRNTKLAVEMLENRRLLAGDLDLSFGSNGKVSTAYFENINSNESANTSVVQSDGKVIVGGSGNVLMRFLPNGEVDRSFGDSGKALIWGEVKGLAIDAQNRIVAAGTTMLNGLDTVMLKRFLPDGQVDRSFGTEGSVLANIVSQYDVVNSLVIQADGKILVGGITNTGSDNSFDADLDIMLLRYDVDGAPDPNFGVNGRVVTSMEGNFGSFTELLLRPDGKIIAVGKSFDANQNTSATAIARFLPNGSLDETFDDDGMMYVTGYPASDSASSADAAVLMSDGKLVIGDEILNGTSVELILIRYLEDGTLDTTFNPNGSIPGVSQFALGQSNSRLMDMQLSPSGHIWISAHTDEGSFFSPRSNVLARVNSDGSLDSSYNGAGWFVYSPATQDVNVYNQLAQRPDGSFVVVGLYRSEALVGPYELIPDSDFAIASFTPEGQLDTAFDQDGFVLADSKFGEVLAGRATLQADGKILTLGTTITGIRNGYQSFQLQWVITRYNENGSLDTTFSDDGRAVTDFADGLALDAKDILVQPDGKILVFGRGPDTFSVLRFLSDGRIDESFGDNGMQMIDFG